MVEMSHAGKQDFFDGSFLVRFGRNTFGLMAATSLSRRYCSFDRIIPLGQKNGGFDISKAAVRKMGIVMDCCTTAFFLLPSCGSFSFLFAGMLIMGRAVRIREHREPQFKLESLAVYDSEGAVAVV